MPKTVMVPVILLDCEIEVLERTNPHLLKEENLGNWVNDLITEEINFFEKEEKNQ